MNSTPCSPAELRQVLVHHIVFALALHEVHPRHITVAGETVHRRGEPLTDSA
jgi:hypothetical protein